MTPQEVLNAAWQHFIVEENPPSIDANNRCLYEDTNGNRCAIGLCIPDNHPALKSAMEVDELIDKYPELFDGDEEVFFTLQYKLHDHLCLNGEWKYTLKERKGFYIQIAQRLGLKVSDHG